MHCVITGFRMNIRSGHREVHANNNRGPAVTDPVQNHDRGIDRGLPIQLRKVRFHHFARAARCIDAKEMKLNVHRLRS